MLESLQQTWQQYCTELPGYHTPNAKVQLLSPQVLLTTVGGQAIPTNADLQIHLNNGINLVVKYCPRSNPPLLSFCNDTVYFDFE